MLAGYVGTTCKVYHPVVMFWETDIANKMNKKKGMSFKFGKISYEIEFFFAFFILQMCRLFGAQISVVVA